MELNIEYSEDHKNILNYFEVCNWMKHNYLIFNTLYFDNILPPPEMIIFVPIIKNVKYLGSATNSKNKIVSRSDPMKIRLNFNYKIYELEWKNVLLHEMIHIWQYTIGKRGGHGKLFKMKMKEINKFGWGITTQYKNILEKLEKWN